MRVCLYMYHTGRMFLAEFKFCHFAYTKLTEFRFHKTYMRQAKIIHQICVRGGNASPRGREAFYFEFYNEGKSGEGVDTGYEV